jgi:hypothetical protein
MKIIKFLRHDCINYIEKLNLSAENIVFFRKKNLRLYPIK